MYITRLERVDKTIPEMEGAKDIYKQIPLSKKDGVPVNLVPEGTPGATVVALKRVDELGFYSMGRDQLAGKVGLTPNKTTAVIDYLKIKENADYYKKFTIGKSTHPRYSQKAIEAIKKCLETETIDEIWEKYRSKYSKKGKK